jgi:FHS family L-fucose permease-like MFS transporter
MAIVGGGLIPITVGAVADHFGVQRSRIIPILCYVYVFYYTFAGSKPSGPGITTAA